MVCSDNGLPVFIAAEAQNVGEMQTNVSLTKLFIWQCGRDWFEIYVFFNIFMLIFCLLFLMPLTTRYHWKLYMLNYLWLKNGPYFCQNLYNNSHSRSLLFSLCFQRNLPTQKSLSISSSIKHIFQVNVSKTS